MALKRKIDKTAFDALPDHFKSEYKENPSRKGEYLLDTEGDEDAEAAKRAKDREKARADEAERKLAEIEKAKKDAEEEAARKSGDISALEKSWQEKLAAKENEFKEAAKKLNGLLRASHIDSVADRLASELSTAPKLLRDHIAKRLDMDTSGETPITRVLDSVGKPSALSLDELKAEFLANKDFAAIMKATNAKGGGAGQNSRLPPLNGGAVNPTGETNLSKMNPRELAAYMKARREGADQT